MDVENDVEKGVENDVDKEDICMICLNDELTTEDKCITQCDHILCNECLNKVFDKGSKCPMCRRDIISYNCKGVTTRLLYKEKKRVRHIQTIIENTHDNKLVYGVGFVLLSINGLFGYLLIQC
jgi:hypothetical protein